MNHPHGRNNTLFSSGAEVEEERFVIVRRRRLGRRIRGREEENKWKGGFKGRKNKITRVFFFFFKTMSFWNIEYEKKKDTSGYLLSPLQPLQIQAEGCNSGWGGYMAATPARVPFL